METQKCLQTDYRFVKRAILNQRVASGDSGLFGMAVAEDADATFAAGLHKISIMSPGLLDPLNV
jgi:hypothetical protein